MEIEVDDNKSRLDINYVHHFLSTKSYWAKNISLELVEKSILHSLCFGVYFQNRQIGFARMITDEATFAYLADVFIDEEFRGKGAGTNLMKYISQHHRLQGLRRIMLMTADAHALYRKFGFTETVYPERVMEKAILNAYQNG